MSAITIKHFENTGCHCPSGGSAGNGDIPSLPCSRTNASCFTWIVRLTLHNSLYQADTPLTSILHIGKVSLIENR